MTERTPPTVSPLPTDAATPARSESIFRRRLRKFRRLKRGYWSFVTIVIAYAISFFLPVLANNTAIAVKYGGDYYFPWLRVYQASDFGQNAIGEADYRDAA